MRAATVIIAVVLMSIAVPATAAPEDVADRVSRDLMSPFCPGLTIHDCPSDASLELRERITAWAERGWTYDRIVDRLEDEYGEDTLRAAPPKEGLGLLAWWLPGMVLAGGVGLAVALSRRWARPVETTGDGAGLAPITPEERARLDAELQDIRGSQ